jgi:hypothetical protein
MSETPEAITINYPDGMTPSLYNNWAFQSILNQHFNRLRARLMNLAEASTRDKQQADAMKGLMKDFVNEAYFPALHEIEEFLRDKGVISKGEGQNLAPNYDHLRAQSLKDILYEPDPQA